MLIAATTSARPACPRISSVEPPPISVSSTSPCSATRRHRDGSGEGEPGLLVPADDVGSHAEGLDDHRLEDVPISGIAHRRRRHHPHRIDTGRPDSGGIFDQHDPGALQGLRIESSGPVDPLAQADDPHLAPDVLQAIAGRIGNEQAQRIGATVQRRDAAHPASAETFGPAGTPDSTAISRSAPMSGPTTHGPAAHHSPRSARASSPSGLTPGPAASE